MTGSTYQFHSLKIVDVQVQYVHINVEASLACLIDVQVQYVHINLKALIPCL